MKHIDELLGPLAGGALSGTERERAERHLRDCRRCAGLYRTLRTRREQMKDLPGPRASDALVSRTLRAVYAEAEQEGTRTGFFRKVRAWWMPWARPVAALAGVFCVILVGVAVLQRTALLPPSEEKNTMMVEPFAAVVPVVTPVLKKKAAVPSQSFRSGSISVVSGKTGGVRAPVPSDERPRDQSFLSRDGGTSNPELAKAENVREDKAAQAASSKKRSAAPELSAPAVAEAFAPAARMDEGQRERTAPELTKVTISRQKFYPRKGEKTTVTYHLMEKGRVTVLVRDASGTVITTLLDSEQEAGGDTVEWDGRDRDQAIVPVGTYTLTVETPQYQENQSIQVIQ